jgi:DNA-binding HxlR family transcriptional regulator
LEASAGAPARRSSVLATFDIVGDHWMLLLLEQLFLGRTSWSALLQELEVSPSTLSKRLSQLIDAECLEKVHSGGRAVDYRLTPRGQEIFATLLAGEEWQRRWGGIDAPALWRHSCGAPLSVRSACRSCDRDIYITDVSFEPGPGAGDATAAMPGRRFRNNKAGVSDWADSDHPLGLLLQVLGDRRAMPLLAALYLGLHRFDEIERWTGVHPAIVSDRLRKLQILGLIKMRLYQERPDRYLYSLAAPGREMFAVTLQMLKWGDKWSYGEGDEPLVLFHEPCGERLYSDLRCRGCGQTIHYRDCEPLTAR